jgi:hypothetical protein
MVIPHLEQSLSDHKSRFIAMLDYPKLEVFHQQ